MHFSKDLDLNNFYINKFSTSLFKYCKSMLLDEDLQILNIYLFIISFYILIKKYIINEKII